MKRVRLNWAMRFLSCPEKTFRKKQRKQQMQVEEMTLRS